MLVCMLDINSNQYKHCDHYAHFRIILLIDSTVFLLHLVQHKVQLFSSKVQLYQLEPLPPVLVCKDIDQSLLHHSLRIHLAKMLVGIEVNK